MSASGHLRALVHIITEIQANAAYNPVRRDHRVTQSQFSALSDQARFARLFLELQALSNPNPDN